MTRLDRYGERIEDEDALVESGPRLQISASRRSRSRAEIHAHAEELRKILAEARERREATQ